MTPGKRQISSMVRLLEEIETQEIDIEDAAKQLLSHAWEMYEQAAKWACVVQEVDPVTRAPVGGKTAESTPKGNCAVLSPEKTRKQAEDKAKSLTMNADKKRAGLAWVVPYHAGTPSGWWRDTQENKQEISEMEGGNKSSEISTREV